MDKSLRGEWMGWARHMNDLAEARRSVNGWSGLGYYTLVGRRCEGKDTRMYMQYLIYLYSHRRLRR
jgi:hypothetical protein